MMTKEGILAIYKHAGIDLTPSGDRFMGKCPFHSEKKSSFIVYPDGGYHCFGCGAHGTLQDISKDATYIPVPDVTQIVGKLGERIAQIKHDAEVELECLLLTHQDKTKFKAYDFFDRIFIEVNDLAKTPDTMLLQIVDFVESKMQNLKDALVQ